ncbi:amidohydrolase, partial [Leucobacter soli]
DRILLAGRVHSMLAPDEETRDRAVLIESGRIQGVVPRDTIRDFTGPATETVDLGDTTLLPGFVDPHAHVEVAAVSQHGVVDVRVPLCRNIGDVLRTLRAAVPRARGRWIVAQGNLFFDKKLDDGRFPTRAELDAVSRDHAIVIRAGGHLSILNSTALELSGIGRGYEATQGSITGKPTVERDERGEPTGIVMEMDNLIPFPRPDDHELLPALESGVRDMFTRHGVTTIGEISETVSGLRAFRAGIADGRIRSRIQAYLWVPGTLDLATACDPETLVSLGGDDPARFGIRGVKVFSDGGFSAARAAIGTEYVHQPGSCGEVALGRDELLEIYRSTQAAGLHLAVHANGDRAQLEVCRALVEARERFGEHPQIRIEHAGNFVPDYARLSSAWREAGIVPVPQPIFIRNFGEFVPEYVGDQAWTQQFPFRTMLADGWEISGSSDVWIGSDYHQTKPMRSVAATIDRLTFHGRALDPSQSIGVWQALRMHTHGGARALGLHGELGSLAVGAHADLVALDADPMSVRAEDLESIAAERVILAGEDAPLPE